MRKVPAQDSVTGRAATCPSVDLDPESCLRAGPLPLPYIGLTADAVSGSSGQDPAGTMSWFEYPGGSMLFSGETQVTCLSVTGNVAIIGVAGTINFVSAFGSFTRPTAGLIRVTDGGGPASGLDSFEFETEPAPAAGRALAGFHRLLVLPRRPGRQAQRGRRPRRTRRPAAADLQGPVQERRLARLRCQFQEPGPVRGVRATRTQALTAAIQLRKPPVRPLGKSASVQRFTLIAGSRTPVGLVASGRMS